MRWPSLAALVFAALVVASVGAFFVTTRLKRSKPAIEQLRFNRFFSPNGDGRLDYAEFGFRLHRTDQATVSIVTLGGDRVRTLADNLQLRRGRRYRFRWDGRTDSGRLASDGEYHVRVSLRHQGRVATSPRKLVLDTTPPRAFVRSVVPEVIAPGGRRDRVATLRFRGPKQHPLLLVYRTGPYGEARLVARRPGRSRSPFLRWDGRVGAPGERRLAAPGSYLLAVRVRDAAGNAGPVHLPPPRGSVPGHPGVTVRYLAAVPPAHAIRAGAVATFHVEAAGRRYRWRVHRLGESHTTSRGRSRAATLHVRAPRGASGVAVLELRAGGHAYRTPFAVQANRHRRVLVVLPTLSWQALNPVEQNGDGYPDVLPLDRRVALDRPYAGDGHPPGFGAARALLAHLDRSRVRYDMATDLTVLRRGVTPARWSGVLIAGSERFAPPPLERTLEAYVRSGGRLAWIGTRGFGRSVALSSGQILRGSPSSFAGERVRVDRGPRALVVLGDRIGFFSGVNSAFGPFPRVEPSLRLPAGAALLASAGPAPRRPALVVYRAGRGIVARVGADGFAGALGSSPAAAQIMRRLWTLLSR